MGWEHKQGRQQVAVTENGSWQAIRWLCYKTHANESALKYKNYTLSIGFILPNHPMASGVFPLSTPGKLV